MLVSNVVLQAGAGVDGPLHALVDGAAQPGVVLRGVEVVRVVLRVVDVVLRAVAPRRAAVTSNSRVPSPQIMKPRTQRRMRMASAATCLTVRTSMAWAGGAGVS